MTDQENKKKWQEGQKISITYSTDSMIGQLIKSRESPSYYVLSYDEYKKIEKELTKLPLITTKYK